MKRTRITALVATLIVPLGLTAVSAAPSLADTGCSTTYDEQYRGQFHFSPACHWMNDPNGLVYYQGEWHLFYQYYPDGNVWGPMHWGHAVSTDLVHWQNLPIALYPDGNGYIFSGSAVVDANNTSGLFPQGTGGLVAVFTYHNPTNGVQSQGIAYSTDRGRTWTKYADNPVIPNPGAKDFRDPKVFWHEAQHKWVMVVAGGEVNIYSSTNLREWTHESTLNGVFTECPDLYPVTAGDQGQQRWVLSLGGRNYYVGDFDGHRFTPTQPLRKVDSGKDFYAAQSWNNAPDGKRYWLGWMNNWDYGQQIPTSPWRSEQTEARTLGLVPDPQQPGQFVLAQQPAPQLDTQLAGAQFTMHDTPIPAQGNLLAGQHATSYEIQATLDVGNAAEIGFTVRTGDGEHTQIGYNVAQKSLYVDRRQSGDAGFSAAFPANTSAPLSLRDGKHLTLRILVDRSSVEVFAEDGTVVFTDQIFPKLTSDGMSVYAVGGQAQVSSMTATPLRSAWTGH